MDEKEKNEMKRFIHDWRISKKYSDFKKMIEDKSKELLNLYSLPKEKVIDYIEKNQLSKKELEKMVDSIIEFSELSEEEKMNLNWVLEELIIHTSKDEIFRSLIQKLLAWYTYISIYQKLEDYEFCSKLIKVCQFEINECISSVKLRIDFDESDIEIINEIDKIIKEKILSC